MFKNNYVSLNLMIVLFVIFLAVLVAIDTPFSMVHNIFHSYTENLELAKSKNIDRVTKSLDYINLFSGPMIHTRKNVLKFELDLLVVIVTVSRKRGSENPRYLLQTAVGMDKLMKKDKHFQRKFMFICNVDEIPDEHADAIQLQDFLPYVRKDGKNNVGLKNIPYPPILNHGPTSSSRIKELTDYVFCLQASKQFNFSYVLMLEDDVIPYENMFHVLDHALKNQRHEMNFDENDKIVNHGNYSFLKLYYPLEWQGYAWELVPILELVSLGTIGGMLFVLTSVVLTENKRASKKQLQSSLTWPFLSGFFVSILVVKILGRIFMMDLRRFSPFLFKFGKSSACCTQAMLYMKDILQPIGDHILVNNDLNKDLAIYDFTQKSGIPGYQIEPNLFHHTGIYTSLSDHYKEPEGYIFDTHIFD